MKKRTSSTLWIAAVVAALAAAVASCSSDVGDSSGLPGGGDAGASDGTAESSSDGSAQQGNADTGGGTGARDSTTEDTGATPDTGFVEDTGTAPDTGSAVDTGAAEDTGSTPDTGGGQDTGGQDAGADSTISEDAADAGTVDSTIQDGATDVQAETTADTGGADASADSTVPDGGGADAADGGQESGADVVESGGGLVPCTTAGQTNCVQCQGNDKAPNATRTCSPTEALLVQHDITKGKAIAPGPDPTGSCYECLFQGGCLDDTHYGDVNFECEDPLITGTAAQCLDTVTCVLGSSCAAAATSICYCGTAGLTTTCQGNPAPGPINGACDTSIAAGLGFPVTDGTDNTAKLTDVTRAAGKAVQIFQCALTNGCAACQ